MYSIAVRPIFQLIRSKVRLKSNAATSQNIISTKQKPQELNEVELIGTIHKQLFTKPSGYKVYVVQTVEPANRFYYHMVGTGTKDVHGAGQRIHLMGRISSQNHWSKEGKLQQKILLKCGDFERLSKDKQSDLNRVRLFAQISEIQNTRDCSAFTLTTRHTPKGGVAAGIFVTDYHRILVREPSLLEMVCQNLKIGDWIDVNGKIDYKFMKNSEGKLRQSGYISANSLSIGNKLNEK